MRPFLFIAIAASLLINARAGEVEIVEWKTEHASVPAELPDKKKHLLPLIRLGVAAVSEAKVMRLTFVGGNVLGLSTEKSKELHRLLAKRYREISADEIFADVPSSLAYCYSAEKPDSGRATVYVPDEVTAETKVILFLHGYGGSFLFYQHFLAEVFPDHLIVCPAYGISCAKIPRTYIEECLAATAEKIGVELKAPVLIGLSAGGFGGFREYTRRPEAYTGFICMAAYPPAKIVPRSPIDGRIRLVAGGDESFVKNRVLQRAELKLKRRTVDYESRLIAGEGHFFMLSAEEETKAALQSWDDELRVGQLD